MEGKTTKESKGIKEVREKTRGWSQARIARETGLSTAQVCRILSGKFGCGHKAQLLLGRRFKIAKDKFFEYD